jgi:hypothetical protein
MVDAVHIGRHDIIDDAGRSMTFVVFGIRLCFTSSEICSRFSTAAVIRQCRVELHCCCDSSVSAFHVELRNFGLREMES